MEDKERMIETLVERTTEYGKTSYALIKLKALDKTSDVVSSLVPYLAALLLFGAFLLFLSLALASWLGELFSNAFLGLLAVALFYGLLALIIHFLMHRWIKERVRNQIINLILK